MFSQNLNDAEPGLASIKRHQYMCDLGAVEPPYVYRCVRKIAKSDC
jgi:hypothetical protein